MEHCLGAILPADVVGCGSYKLSTSTIQSGIYGTKILRIAK